MSAIELREVTKTFPNGYDAVRGVDMTIADGEFMVLVGPSGCGKTTLLRMIAGLDDASGGSILIGDRDVVRRPPGERDIAMVFQSYALYPHMTVRKNLGYGLKVRGVDRAQVKRRVEEVARMLSLEELLDRRPAALSGGQRQRVAMGRAIVREPAAYLMDEPLSNLDARLRVGMRAQLSQLHERLGVTTVYVTHDQVEAMTLGQRVAVMRGGTIQQVADPLTLYESPANVFVAAFIGSPPMNLVGARIAEGRVELGALSLPVPHRHSGPVVAGLRPEAFVEPAHAQPDWPRFDVEAVVVEQLGAETHVIFPIDAPSVTVDGLESGGDVSEDDAFVADTRTLLTARLDGRRRTMPGDTVRLAADPSALYLFDAETGAALTA